MCGKPLVKNLIAYLESIEDITIPVYAFDRNQEKNLPCIVVGYSGENMSFPGGHGHYTVEGYVNVCVQGYEDDDNTDGDAYADIVIAAVVNNSDLFDAMNKPAVDPDTRPATNFNLNGFFMRGIDRNIDGTSEEISIRFDAFAVAKDK